MFLTKKGGYLKKILLLCILTIASLATTLEDKYPSYSYVFDEFDVDADYIYNDQFIAFVKRNHKRYKNFYQHSLTRGGYLIPTFKSMLIQDDLSDLFVYLAMVESGFQTDALSSKKATGIWQFMKATAKQYKLDVNSNFDERLDPILATSAAMRYLHKLHNDFGKWYLAMMAYNCGEGRLQKGIDRAGSDELAVLMNPSAGYLPKETRLYINKILLVSMIGENITLGFGEVEGELTQLYGEEVVQVEVEAGERLDYIAKMIDMKPKDLLKINHHFKNGTVPVSLPRYTMNIPADKVVDFYATYVLKKELERNAKNHFLSHIVTEGESLAQIASRYNLTINELIASNSKYKGKIVEGQLWVVPVTKEVFETFVNKDIE